MPVKKIVALLRSKGVIGVIDGAHCIGNINIDVADIDPDFYFSNIHKWFFGAKSCCFFYVRPEFRDVIHPTRITYKYKTGFTHEFAWMGTKEQAAFLSVPASFKFVVSLGGHRAFMTY